MNAIASIFIGAILIGSLTAWLAFRISGWDNPDDNYPEVDIDEDHEIDRKIE